MRDIAARVHAAGDKIVGATILPMCNPPGSVKEQTRLAVNDWIRTSGTFDAVLDFDAVLRDPNDPTVIYAPWRYRPNRSILDFPRNKGYVSKRAGCGSMTAAKTRDLLEER
jgi:hypothetical protein